jgi:HlyD family secretion protein
MSSQKIVTSYQLPVFSMLCNFVVIGLFGLGCLCGRTLTVEWRTVPIEKGDLNVEVTASGIANPHFLVQVGTQVSGTIARIVVDFNSHVQKGQLIALLDTTFLHAAIEDAKASLRKAEAQESLARKNAERTKQLFDKGLAAQADLDQATADYESTKAAISSVQSALDRAKINLAYAFITSPITGVVVNRNVDMGQTVAASFSTPTLFTIADDLSKMQLQASIDEADIGQVKVGQIAQFTVDAYPDRKFIGTVTQLRLQPSTVQNVVTYTVMIDFNNPDLAIMPGMTANITIVVQQAHDVLKVPVAALKFTPSGESPAAERRKTADKDTGSNKPSAMGISAVLKGRGSGHRGLIGNDTASGKGGFRDSIKTLRKKDQSRIFILENGKPKRIPVKTGISNGGYVAVEGDNLSGQMVIVGTINNNTKASSTQKSPLGGGQGPGGMPRRM